MNLLWKMLNGFVAGQPFKRSLTIREPDGWIEADRIASSGESVTWQNTLGLSTVWACVNLLAGTLASLQLVIYERGKAGIQVEAPDHPLYRLLHDSPNADQTAMDFIEFLCVSLELWGNAYASITRGSGGRIIELLPIRPDLVSVRRLADGALAYRWTEEGKTFDLRQEEMLHIRGFGGSPLGGMSTLAFGRNTFGLALAIDRAANATFANGLRPSGTLTFEKFLNQEQRDIAKNNLVAQFVGAMNAGRPLVLEGGTKWEALTINPEDAQMLQSRGFSVEQICHVFGVPPFMIGHSEKSTSWGSSLKEQTLGFQKFGLRRRAKRIEGAMEKQLLSPADRARGIRIELNFESLLRGDSTERTAFYGSGLRDGWLTINWVRAQEGLPPVPGGDVPRMQMQNVPITQAGVGHDGGPPLKDEE